MNQTIAFGTSRGKQVKLDVGRFMSTRGLIQANSGGGKSYLIRKLLEMTHPLVQQIVIDLEGEFSTLREKFDYILIGKDGDVPISIKVAEALPRKILELNVSVILDLSELKAHERILFVKRFLDSLMNLPKKYWKPLLIIVDEAHHFCPEKGKADSMSSVVDLMTRGRKRGYNGVLATQRLSKLSKDAAAEANNVWIGRTGLDIDMKRAGDTLGMNSHKDVLSLRALKPGEFYVFGPSMNPGVELVKIGMVLTSHPEPGKAKIETMPPRSKVLKALEALKSLPVEAEKEAKTIATMESEVRSLRGKLAVAERNASKLTTSANSIVKDRRGYETGFKDALILNQKERKALEKIRIIVADVGLTSVGRSQDKKPAIQTSRLHRKELAIVGPENYLGIPRGESSLRKGAVRMLQAIVSFNPEALDRYKIATIAGISVKSGTFSTYLGDLVRGGFIEKISNGFVATNLGIETAGDVGHVDFDPESLLRLWQSKVRAGASRMLEIIFRKYPDGISREDLAIEANIASNSGTFSTYLGDLRRNGLITTGGGEVKATPALFPKK